MVDRGLSFFNRRCETRRGSVWRHQELPGCPYSGTAERIRLTSYEFVPCVPRVSFGCGRLDSAKERLMTQLSPSSARKDSLRSRVCRAATGRLSRYTHASLAIWQRQV